MKKAQKCELCLLFNISNHIPIVILVFACYVDDIFTHDIAKNVFPKYETCNVLFLLYYVQGVPSEVNPTSFRFLEIQKSSPLVKVTSSPKKVIKQLEVKNSRPPRPPEASKCY